MQKRFQRYAKLDLNWQHRTYSAGDLVELTVLVQQADLVPAENCAQLEVIWQREEDGENHSRHRENYPGTQPPRNEHTVQFRTKSDWTFEESYLDSDKFLSISFVSSKQQFLSIRSGVTGISVEIENSSFSG